MADEMVRYAERPDGLLADSNDAQEVADLLFAHDDEVAQVAIAIRLLVEIGFLEEREGCLYVSNFREAQASLDARRKREKRNDSQKQGESPAVSGRVRNVRTKRTSPECPAVSAVSGHSQRLDQTRPDLDPLPPTPSVPDPSTQPADGGGSATEAITARKLATLPGSDKPIDQRARHYLRDPGSRSFMGDPVSWPEIVKLLDVYRAKFPKLVCRPKSYQADNRVRCLVDRLSEGNSVDDLAKCIIAASVDARRGTLEEKHQRLDAILANPGQVDRWLGAAQEALGKRTGAGSSRVPKASQRGAEAEQTGFVTKTPAELAELTRAIGVGL